MRTKDLIPNKVKEFISRAQLETTNQVFEVTTDNGSEFCNIELESYFA